MKIILFLFGLILAVPAQARLGETLAECQTRYGPNGRRTSFAYVLTYRRGHETWTWNDGSMEVEADFFLGRCEAIAYRPESVRRTTDEATTKRGLSLVRESKVIATPRSHSESMSIQAAERITRVKVMREERMNRERLVFRRYWTWL